MPTIQDQYTEFANPITDIAKPFQDATMAIAQAWTRSVQETAARVPAVATQAATQAAANQVIDQAYDFVNTVIDVQRNLSKQIFSTTSTAAEDVVQRATAAVNDAGAQAFEAAANVGRTKKTSA